MDIFQQIDGHKRRYGNFSSGEALHRKQEAGKVLKILVAYRWRCKHINVEENSLYEISERQVIATYRT